MRNVWAVYRKEMMQYFRSPIAYFVVSVFLIGTGSVSYTHLTLPTRS